MKPKLTKEERAANRRIFFDASKIDCPSPAELLDERAVEMYKKMKEQSKKGGRL